MGAHTPGPWRAVDASSSALPEEWSCHEDTKAHSSWRPIVDAEGRAVALVVDAGDGYTGRPSFDADARLIAAAPDMLDALQRIAAYRPLTFAECSDAEAIMGIAERAIAKATQP